MPEAVTVELVARRYVLDRIVGSGGFGDVWRATDSMLSRQVAVKVLRPEFAREPDASRLLRTEAQHRRHGVPARHASRQSKESRSRHGYLT